MWKKLPLIDEDVKLKIIDNYLELAESKYNVMYYLWRKEILKKKRKFLELNVFSQEVRY